MKAKVRRVYQLDPLKRVEHLTGEVIEFSHKVLSMGHWFLYNSRKQLLGIFQEEDLIFE